MNSNKTFVFMVLIAIIFIGLTWFFSPKAEQEKKTSGNEIKKETNIDKNTQTNLSFSSNISVNKNSFDLVEVVQTKEYDLSYENKNIKIKFNPNDAIIKHAWVKDSFLNRKNTILYDLVQGDDQEGSLRLKFGFWDKGFTISQLTGGKNFFNLERQGNSFIFSCQIKNKNDGTIYIIKKIYKFLDNENIFKLDIEISNDKNIPINFDNSGIAYSITWGPLLGFYSKKETQNDKPQYNMFEYLKGENLEKVTQDTKIVKENNYFGIKTREGTESWISNSEHYFTTIIYPDNQNYKFIFDFRDRENKNYYCGFARDTREKSVLKSTYYVYIGPKIGSILKRYENFNKDDFLLKDTKFSKIEQPIFFGLGNLLIGPALKFIYDLVKNYGIAIIILTFIIKLLLAPLTHKSMTSQEKMTKIQPKIKELQDKYKDKPDLLNKKIMALYKKEGINPFGGCLPLLLQMPILMAMYELLDKMVDLKGANFLWIKDLSAPDAILNLGYTIPLVNIYSLNIMPILMTIVSIGSTLLMPNIQSNKKTQIMMWMMPLLFFFMFYNVSSGLVLYWTVMNILNLVQQVYINNISKMLKKASA